MAELLIVLLEMLDALFSHTRIRALSQVTCGEGLGMKYSSKSV